MFGWFRPQWRLFPLFLRILWAIVIAGGPPMTLGIGGLLPVPDFLASGSPLSGAAISAGFFTLLILPLAFINHLIGFVAGRRVATFDLYSTWLLDRQLFILVGTALLDSSLANDPKPAPSRRRDALLALTFFWPAIVISAFGGIAVMALSLVLWPIYSVTGWHPAWWPRFAGRCINALDAGANYFLLGRWRDYDLVIRRFINDEPAAPAGALGGRDGPDAAPTRQPEPMIF